MKRMCIKTLPPVLVIQLKRFGYDWEAGRALKFDDHFEVTNFLLKNSSPKLSLKTDSTCSHCFLKHLQLVCG